MLWKISRRKNNPNLLFLGKDLYVFCRIMKVLNNNSKFLAVSLKIVLLKELTTVLSISHG